MAGYLDQYGEGEDRRSKIIKIVAVAVAVILVVGGGLFWCLRTYGQESEVKRFFALLADRNYEAAYQLWGCSQATPCRDYSMRDFMNDWGPQALPDPRAAHITSAETCGSGAIITVSLAGGAGRPLWVENSTHTLGFAPVPVCPGRGPVKIMLTRLRDHLR